MRKIWIYAAIALLALMTAAVAGATSPPTDLPRTGQVWSYDANTPQRDDGALQAGAVWPEPRFTDNGDQTVKDNLTGIVWAKDAGAPTVGSCTGGYRTWQQALDYVACLNTNNYLGHNDWRLPNINELESLVDLSESYPALPASHPFASVQSDDYWSSSTFANSTSFAWNVSMGDGYVDFNGKSNSFYVWPVRSGQCGSLGDSVICLSKTGQTLGYATGDDGDLGKGVSWPSLRFTDNGNETVTDSVTGLIWTKDANAPGPAACGSGISKRWQGALDYVACLNTNNYLGHNDWRLPDRKELYSLIDRSKYGPALPTGHPFTSVRSDFYWSSSAYAFSTDYAWLVGMNYGGVLFDYKDSYNYVWPVRSGQFGNSVICSFAVSPASEVFICSGGADSVPVAASHNICEWSALSNDSWLSIISGSSGTGNGAVNFTATANNGAGPRTGTLTIAGRTVSITQLNTATVSSVVEPPQTGQTMGYATGDDGDLEKGVSLPSPRFTDNGDQTVKDNLTGLVWAKDAGAPTVGSCTGGFRTWQQALDYVACLNTNNYLGHNDWRLPNVGELYSHVDRSKYGPALPAGHPFTSVQSNYYWSSSTSASNTGSAWGISMNDGYMNSSNKSYRYYVWPVRSGQCGSLDDSVICLSKTGQTTSYATGDDGDLERGVAWPTPRFVYNGNGTVSDNLTGLEWTKSADAPGPAACGPGTSKTWQGALDYVTCLNTNSYLGHADWRLPNVNELYSLVDRSKYGPALPVGHPFTSVQSFYYWSSSTHAYYTNGAWDVNMGNGYVDGDDKDYDYYVWPVRGGQSGLLDNLVLSVSKTGAGSGVVTASNGTINWSGNSGAATYISGTQLTLTATPSPGSTFTGWDGCDSVKGGRCLIKMTEDRVVTATFTEFPKLTVTVETGESEYGIGTGTVVTAGIKCGNAEDEADTDCDQAFNKKTKVTLKAVADTGSLFSAWDGCDTTQGSTCVVIIDTEDKEVIATFIPTPRYMVTVTKDGNGGGKVTVSQKGIDGTGINCDADNTDCESAYSGGAVITLVAKADNGAKFTGWSGYPACEGKTTGTCKISRLSGDVAITTTFGSPEMSLSVDTLDFGDVDKNDTASQTFTISNSGYGNLTIAFKFSGADSRMFKVYNSLGKVVSKATVAAGTTPEFEVRFKPTATGEKTGTLTISTNDSNNTKVEMPLSGFGQ